METKTREQMVRKSLYKMGYKLHKSRVRNVNVDNLGLYMVIDSSSNAVICGSSFDCDLDDIVSFFQLDC